MDRSVSLSLVKGSDHKKTFQKSTNPTCSSTSCLNKPNYSIREKLFALWALTRWPKGFGYQNKPISAPASKKLH